jgi:hypothetical protein
MGETFKDRAEHYWPHGIPVFPVSRSKVPLTPRGFHDATTDEATILEWDRRWPDANVSILTGKISDIAVLDVDGEQGEQSLRELADRRGIRFRSERIASTGRGRHLYFKWIKGLKCSAGKLAPGLDVRAEGGAIIAPPSIHASGRPYEWLCHGPLVPFPMTAYLALYAPPTPVFRPVQTASVDLNALAAGVAVALPGTRNHALNRAAYTAGGLIGSGKCSEAEAREALLRAGMAAGLTREECLGTLRSGLRAGQRMPI